MIALLQIEPEPLSDRPSAVGVARIYAARTLWLLGGEATAARETLFECLRDPRELPLTRECAGLALGRMGQVGLALLDEALGADPASAMWAAAGYWASGRPLSATALQALASDQLPSAARILLAEAACNAGQLSADEATTLLKRDPRVTGPGE